MTQRPLHLPRLVTLGLLYLILCDVGLARGALVTNLTVQETPQASGLFLYTYSLTVSPSGDVPAGAFVLDIAAGADLGALTGPTGWDIAYAAGDTEVAWVSSDPAFDLQPGTSGFFQFLSPLGADDRDYIVVGFGTTDIFTETGRIAGPGVTVPAAVPEPTSLALLSTGTFALLGLLWTGRGRVRDGWPR